MATRQMRVTHVTQMTRSLKRAAELSGGWTGLARALSHQGDPITKQAVHNWLTRGVPAERAVQIEQVTREAIPRHELRPDIFEGYVRQELGR